MIEIVAHRGLHSIHAENSLASFAAAWEADVQWCECDVHASRDGVPVVIHDPTFDDGKFVVDFTAAELSGIAPMLRQVLAQMPNDRGMLIEIKPDGTLPLVDAVLDESRGHRCTVQSFYPANLFHAMQRMNELALLVESPQVLTAAVDCPWPMVHVDQKLLDLPQISEIERCGKRLGVWTVNSDDEIRRAIHSGAVMLITDRPVEARKLCSDRSA